MKKTITLGLLGFIFVIAGFAFATTAQAEEVSPELVLLQQSLDILQETLNQIEATIEVTGVAVSFSEMNTALATISQNLQGITVTLANIDSPNSSSNFASSKTTPALPGIESAGIELVESETELLTSTILTKSTLLMSVIVGIPVILLSMLIWFMFNFGKGPEAKVETE